jgi:hypothetical protein
LCSQVISHTGTWLLSNHDTATDDGAALAGRHRRPGFALVVVVDDVKAGARIGMPDLQAEAAGAAGGAPCYRQREDMNQPLPATVGPPTGP